jgi:hypothetical protein
MGSLGYQNYAKKIVRPKSYYFKKINILLTSIIEKGNTMPWEINSFLFGLIITPKMCNIVTPFHAFLISYHKFFVLSIIKKNF